MSHTKGWRVWFLWINIAILVITLFFYQRFDAASSTETFHAILLRWIRRSSAIGGYSLESMGPVALIALLLIYERRLKALVWTALGICGFKIIAEILFHFNPDVPAYGALLDISSYGCAVMSLILLLFFPVFQRRHRWVQTATAILIVMLLVVQEVRPLRFAVYRVDTLAIMYLLLVLAALAGVSAAAYLGLFHRVPAPHQPPMDAADRVALTCPRCGVAQIIPTGGGGCSNCRLQIFVALTEGKCPNCNYLLRGLTSGRCPECGRSIDGSGAEGGRPLSSAVTANRGDPAA